MEHVTCQTFFRIKTIVANFPVCSKWDMLMVAWERSRWRQSQHIRWIIAIENNYALYLRSWWKKLKFISCRECTDIKYFYRHLKANGMNEPDKHEIVSILYSRWSILQKWEQKYKKICPVLSVSIPGEWCLLPLIFFIMLQDIASVVAVSGQYVTVESYVEAKHDLHIFKIGDFYRAITWVHYPITDREI